MMDPLSIIASVITLAEAATQISKAISRLRHFGELPSKIYALKNEISDLEIVLRRVSHSLNEELLVVEDAYESLEQMLSRTKSRLEDLAKALERIANAFSGSKIRAISKSAVWHKERETFQSFRDDIGSIKSSLILLLSASTSQNAQHLVLELRKITVLSPNAGDTSYSATNTSSNHLELSSLINQRHEVLSDRIDALGKMLQLQSPANAPTSIPTGKPLTSEKTVGTQMMRVITSPSLPYRNWCPCACHTKQKVNLATPAIMQGLLGKMFIVHSRLPLLKGNCDFRGCRHQHNTSAVVEYRFPSWLVSKNLKLSFTYLPSIGSELLLSTTTRVADDAQSITFAMQGNIDGLKTLFETGQSGPRDVSDSRGFSLVRWALYGGMHNYETVKFLLSKGALVDEVSFDNVWDFIFRGKCTEKEQSHLRCITDGRGSDWIEEQNFPLVHRIVLGLSSKALQVELDENPRAVDLTDSQNRSALDWATARAQLDDMAVLLKYGADPNNMDVTGRTAVLHAVDSHDSETLRLILEWGGDPNPTYPKGMFRSSPLTAAGFAGMPELLKLLLQFEAHPNACNPEGITALHSVARTHNIECASLLLEYGADLNAMSSHGRTPLTTAIIHNNHLVLQLFTAQCWEYMTVPRFDVPQILPVIAEYADVQTINILSSVHPLKISYDISSSSLATNRLLLEQRSDYDEKLGDAFETLIAAARAGIEHAKSPDSVVESGFFISARSSFHSELSSAVLKLQSVNVSPTDSVGFGMEKWQNSEEAFYSPISPITRHGLPSPILPFPSKSVLPSASSAQDHFHPAP